MSRQFASIAFTVSVLLAVPASASPPVPEGAVEGELVEVEGELYEVRGGELVPLEEAGEPAAPAEPPATETAPGAPATPAVTKKRDEGVLVTGSRVDRRRDKATVKTETIDNETLKQRVAPTLADALAQESGIQINNNKGGQQISMDGLDGKYVLVLVDGRPVNGRVDDRVDISRLGINPQNVERIEVVRGPQSALYGSEAIGGVVNIITKRPKAGIHGSVNVGGAQTVTGPFQQFGDAELQGSAGPFLFRVNGSLLNAQGVDRGLKAGGAPAIPNAEYPPGFIIDRPDGKFELPDRRLAVVNGEITAFLNDDWETRVGGSLMLDEKTLRTTPAVPFRDNSVGSQYQLTALIKGDVLPGHEVAADFRVDQYTHVSAKLPDGGDATPPPFCVNKDEGPNLRFWDPECPAPAQIRYSAVQRQSRGELRYTGTLAEDILLVDELSVSTGVVAIGEMVERVDGEGSDTIPGGGETWRGAVYGELMWRPVEWLSILPGFRADGWVTNIDATSGLYGGNPGPKVAVRADLGWGFALRASYGQGYRMPSFQERFLIFDHSDLGYMVVGNQALTPEKSHGARTELLWSDVDWGEVGAEAYVNLLEGQIAAVPTGQTTQPADGTVGVPIFAYVNYARSYTSGLNLRASMRERWGFKLAGSYQYIFNAVDASSCPDENPYFCSAIEGARTLPLIPDHSFHVEGSYRLAATGTIFFSHLEYLSQRQVSVGEVARGWVNVGTGLRQNVFDHAEMVLLLDNLLDQHDPVYGPKPGINARATLRAWF